MKKSHIQLLILEILMIVIFVLGTYVLELFSLSNIASVLFWLVSTAIIILRFGFEKDKHLYKVDIFQILFLYCVSYLILTYLFGLIIGFVRSPYSMVPLTMIKNIIPVAIIIVCQELFRYVIVKKGNKYIISIAVFILILFDVILKIGGYNFGNPMEIFECIGGLILPAIINNLLLTYLCVKSGYKTTLFNQLIFGLYIFIVPIYPDLGVYFSSIFNIAFPCILFLALNSFLGKMEYNPTSRVVRSNKTLLGLPTTLLVISVVVLVSGVFKVYMMSIGSGSMEPNINKGDAIIIEKLTTKDFEKLEKGDIIVFNHDSKMVVHRIIKIREENDRYIFNTKGDNNDEPDNYDIKQTDVKGIVLFKVRFIGYPSVWIGELSKR